jgi:hypothetical protein
MSVGREIGCCVTNWIVRRILPNEKTRKPIENEQPEKEKRLLALLMGCAA